MTKWFYWRKPGREKFQSDEAYANYMEMMKCEECGQDLQEGDYVGLIPYQSALESGSNVVEARIVHYHCCDSK